MTVLIIAEDADFSRDVVSRWQTERNLPTFAVISSAVAAGPALEAASSTEAGKASCAEHVLAGEFDLAILAPMPETQAVQALKALDAAAPVVAIAGGASFAQRLRNEFPRVLVVRQTEGWLDSLVLLAGEVLRRVEAGARARQAEELAAVCQRQATLGQYMLEMRHGLNNALTSVLGNAELLLLEPGAMSASMRDQIDTIHSMALRMHRILQRFSSLDAEMQFAQKQSQPETQVTIHAPDSNC